MENIFHYTTGTKMDQILDAGRLVPSPWEKAQKLKRPALWFSSNPFWEPTAAKSIRLSSGEQRLMTMEEHVEYADGLYRFILPYVQGRWVSWAKYRHLSKQPQWILDALEREGISRGAKPSDWWASFESVSLTEVLAIQEWHSKSGWIEMKAF